MRAIDERAWQILTEEERTALSLQFGLNKSTWEAGEIMGKAHYKYLEIKQRGEKFLKMFTRHLAVYNTIIPVSTRSLLPPKLLSFLTQILSYRLTVKEATTHAGYSTPSDRNKDIVKFINLLKDGITDPEYSDMMLLILDFDRWNNFRILPPSLQEPSAYKRRNKNRYKKHLRVLKSINPIIYDRLASKFPPEKGYITIHLPMISRRKKLVLELGTSNATVISYLSSMGLYCFHTRDAAEDYQKLVNSYLQDGVPSCREGLKFWPKFREAIESSINYNLIETPLIKRELDYSAMVSSEFDLVNPAS